MNEFAILKILSLWNLPHHLSQFLGIEGPHRTVEHSELSGFAIGTTETVRVAAGT
jgi:hypothetical protein